MRRSELFKLQWPDVDFVGNVITVLATNPKTERGREIGMTPRVRQALSELRAQAPPSYKGTVFGRGSKKDRDAWLPIRDTIISWSTSLPLEKD